jgi:hypothetical protein
MSETKYTHNTPIEKLGGARRKNGHKSNCTCHICENMKNKAKRGGYEEDVEKEKLKRMGGSKKKNGHKPDCGCPICKNMKNSKKKKGGGDESSSDSDSDIQSMQIAGKKKKSNGHKENCGCPICKNMRKTHNKKGGEEPDIENQLGDIEEGQVKAEPLPSKTETRASAKETFASDSDYDALDAAEKGIAGPNVVGGTRKKRKTNGHKSNCRCPICKNMKKGRKTRRHKKNYIK